MELNKPQEISEKINKLLKVNLFENNRKQENVEARALLVYLLREKFNMRWTHIARFFNDNGKDMNHATIMYLFKKFPDYSKFNKNLKDVESLFVFDKDINLDIIDKVLYWKNKYKKTLKQNDNLKYQIKITQKEIKRLEESPSSMLDGCTFEQQEQIKERVALLKKSWTWKSKDKCQVIECGSGISGLVH